MFASNSSASFRVRMSAKSATSTMPAKPSALNAVRNLPGVTSSENWLMTAGATMA